MERLESLALVVGVARCLAVDGEQIMPAGPEFLDPALETAPEQRRIKIKIEPCLVLEGKSHMRKRAKCLNG
jgi:hypothetical protein